METRRHPATELAQQADIENMLAEAIALYGQRIGDNLDLDRVATPAIRAKLVGRTLMEHCDARAFILGRRLVAAVGR